MRNIVDFIVCMSLCLASISCQSHKVVYKNTKITVPAQIGSDEAQVIDSLDMHFVYVPDTGGIIRIKLLNYTHWYISSVTEGDTTKLVYDRQANGGWYSFYTSGFPELFCRFKKNNSYDERKVMVKMWADLNLGVRIVFVQKSKSISISENDEKMLVCLDRRCSRFLEPMKYRFMSI